MKKNIFAISIGSSVTSIYKGGVGVVLSDKTALVTGIEGKREVALHVGSDAITSGLDYRKVIENGHVDFSLAELLLSQFFKKIEVNRKDEVLFLVPLENMGLVNEYKNLGYALGINKVRILPSIIATSYGFEIEKFRKSFLLCDIGANCEIAIINNGRIVSGATVYNGGSNIDGKIADYIYKEKGIELSRESAEKVKNELATLLPNDIRTITVDGFIKDTTEFSSITISSTDIFSIFVEEYGAIANAILQVLTSISNEANLDIKQHGIYLCGASSQIAGIEKFFKAKLNLESIVYKPSSVTMIGAGQLLDNPFDIDRVVAENLAM